MLFLRFLGSLSDVESKGKSKRAKESTWYAFNR